MPDNVKRMLEIKCNEARYRELNHPLRRGLKAIRAFQHRYEGHKIFSDGEWGGLHYLVYGSEKHWRDSFDFAINVARITSIVGILHLDCAWAKWKMEQLNIGYSLETEMEFCLRTARASTLLLNYYASGIPFEIFLHHEEEPYEAYLFNPIRTIFEPFTIPLVEKNQIISS